MRRKGIVLLLVLALTLWALPTAALADGDPTSSGEVGTIEASLTSEVSTSSSASAASSAETGDSVGAVDASAFWEGGASSDSQTDSSDVPVEVDNGGGSTTEIGQFSTSAQAEIDPDHASAEETVENVTVSAPHGLPFDYLAIIDVSGGEAVVGDGEGSTDYNFSGHTLEGVSLFDGIITFRQGGASAYSWEEGESEPYGGWSAIGSLSIWDPDTLAYVDFGWNSFNEKMWDDPNDPLDPLDHISEKLAGIINVILAKSNLKMTKLVDAGLETTDVSTFAWATLMEILYPASGDVLLRLILADVSSQTNFALVDGVEGQVKRIMTDAWAKGKELYFEYTAPPKPAEQPKPTEPPPTEPTPTVTAPQPEIQPAPVVEAPVAQPAPAAQPQAQPAAQPEAAEQLPVTGFNFSWLLLGVGLILTGLRLRRI